MILFSCDNVQSKIELLREAWTQLISDFQKAGKYCHMGEEDLRCYFFCKILHKIEESEYSSEGNFHPLDLHAEQKLTEVDSERLDLVFGLSNENGWDIGIEIKRTLDGIEEDLQKLQKYMRQKKIKAGILVAILTGKTDPIAYFNKNIIPTYQLQSENLEGQNYIEWDRIQIHSDKLEFWEAVFVALRTIDEAT